MIALIEVSPELRDGLRKAGEDILECPSGRTFDTMVAARRSELDAVVVGPEVADPLQAAARACRVDTQISVVILGSDADQCDRIRAALQLAQLIGNDVECTHAPHAALLSTIAVAATRTRSRRQHRRTLAAMGTASIDPMPRLESRQLRGRHATHLIDLAPIGIIATDDDRRVLSASEEAARILGTTERAMVGLPLPGAAVGIDASTWERLLDAEEHAADPLRFARTIGGETRWLEARAAAVSDDSGQGYLVVFADVTERVVAEEARRAALESERRGAEEQARRFQLLVESVKDYAIFILDPNGNVATWNPGAERIKGYTASEIVGKHFSVFYPPEVATSGKCEAELDVAIREGRFEEEGWRVRKDGSRFLAKVTITVLRDPASGALVGFAKVTQDLTERRNAEEEARRFQLLVESVKDYAIFILDPNGNVATWNPGAERIKEYTASEIIGKHFSVFYPPEVATSGKCVAELDVATREGRFEEEGWRVRKDGSRFWANVTITSLRDPASGALVGFAKVTRDLTERLRNETTLRQLAAEKAAFAEKARLQEFQERFIAILGHDLRNPLSAVDMGASLVRQRAASLKDETLVRVGDRMKASSRRMSRMIEQILDLTRSRLAGGLEIKPESMNLGTTIAAVVDEIRAAHPSRDINLRCPSTAAGAWDRDRLEQVFSNLVGNAVNYGDPAKPVTIDVREEGADVVVTVHNEGRPIAEALREELFSPFRRGERDSKTTETEGLGLGLYISRELAVAHGGDIDVRSSETEGTTFRVRLPRLSSAPEAILTMGGERT